MRLSAPEDSGRGNKVERNDTGVFGKKGGVEEEGRRRWMRSEAAGPCWNINPSTSQTQGDTFGN